MSLNYAIQNNLTINVDPEYNAQIETPLTGNFDLAYVGFANFLSGDYKQDATNADEIQSNLTLNQSALNSAAMWLVNDLGNAVVAGGRTAYGNNVGVTGTYYAEDDETQYNVVAADDTESDLANELTSNYAGKDSSFVPMVNLSSASSGIEGKGLVRGQSGIGHALLQGVNAALFKKLGKDVAILNDSSVITEIQNEFFNQINSEMSEVQNDKLASKFFRRYLESGRLQSDSADINGVDYNLQNVNVTMIATITGTVTDSDGPAANASVINVIFGNSSASETKVVSNGSYSIDAHITLKHDGRF